jgi:CheY-like chemotaxis protein
LRLEVSVARVLPGGLSVAKILVADDNSNIQKMVGLALKDQGIDVVAVGNGEAAVRKISDVRPDLVLADVFMPVRNGYEVCRYVKEDSALSHIPVILLVGAFDPLDEQEAQRVGADGVLKKPFVPPDPLISMVKSALMRAGVPLGPPAAQEKPAAVPGRSAAELVGSGVGSTLPALGGEPLPQASPEPIEEFPAAPSQVQIPEGQGPLAFGNLLNSTETEEEAVFSSKPMINIAGKHNWDEEQSDEPEEEEEEEEERLTHGWRPSAMDEEVERVASSSTSAPDWRDEAFHGSSPAKNQPSASWASAEKTTMVEAAESQSVAISTLESKPAEASSPFASDAWAAAMAAGVEEKIAESEAHVPEVESKPEPVVPASEPAFDELAKSLAAPPVSAPPEPERESEPLPAPSASAPIVEETKAAEPGNWAPVPEASWEAEAKRASMLASTWDSAPARSPEETQEVPSYTSEQASTQPEAPAEQPVSAYSSHFSDEHEVHATPPAIEEPARTGALPKAWENTWESPAPPAVHHAEPEPHHANGTEVTAAEHAPVESSAPVEAAASQNMDELVARVLGKMNPEVLQKVTREILKPVIEAIVRDELSSKK